MSSSRMCWTMCIAKDCSPRRSIGEMSAAASVSAPAANASMRPTGRGAGAVPGADAPPARHVDRPSARPISAIAPGSNVHEASAATAQRLSQSCGRGVTLRPASMAGCSPTPRSADCSVPSPMCSSRSPCRRAARLLVVPCDGGGRASRCARRAGRSCASCAGRAAPGAALPAPCGRRCPAAGSAVEPGVGAGRLRGPGARARARAEVPRRARGGRRDGRAGRRGRAGRAACRTGDARPGADAPAAPARCAASIKPTGWRPRCRRARALPVGVVWCAPERRRAKLERRVSARRAPGRIDVRVRGDPPRSVVLVDDVHTTGATLRGVRCGAATSGRLHRVCGRICAGVELT